MTQSLSLLCTCGKVRGIVAEAGAKTVNRVVCYCDDCQAFVRFLKRPEVMNERGGTDIVQVAPSRVEFLEGVAQLRCMRLSEKGLLRWYTECCRTPAGNMLPAPWSPFVGIATAFFEASRKHTLDDVVGPPRGGIQGRFAIGGCPPGVARVGGFGVAVKSVGFVLGNLFASRNENEIYWNPETKQPLVPPRILSKEERDALRG